MIVEGTTTLKIKELAPTSCDARVSDSLRDADLVVVVVGLTDIDK